MFDLVSTGRKNCDGITRRNLLRVGALGAFGLSLPRYLQARDSAASSPTPDTNCILIWLQGGLSHIDSFDPKPEAPTEIKGEFNSIDTAVPGLQLTEHLPRLAAQQEKFSILRSLNPRNGSHGVADAYMMSGHKFNPTVTFPCYGAVVSKEKGDRGSLPPFIQVGTSVDQRSGGGVAGFLGDQFNPFVLPGDSSNPSFSVRDVTLPSGVDHARFVRRLKALQAVDTWQDTLESNPNSLVATDTFYEKAYRLITSPEAKQAFNLASEDPRLRDRYGRNSLGHGCLLARRLIEAGTRFVTVTDGGWDTHQNNFKSLSGRLLPRLDHAIATLIQDLYDRGLLESTLVVCLSDFGRTPKVNPSAGRDHWSTASVALFAGGGLTPGRAVGQTNALAEQPIDAPYYTEDVAATIYTKLGIPLDTTHQTPDGRPIPVNYDGRPIQELLGG